MLSHQSLSTPSREVLAETFMGGVDSSYLMTSKSEAPLDHNVESKKRLRGEENADPEELSRKTKVIIPSGDLFNPINTSIFDQIPTPVFDHTNNTVNDATLSYNTSSIGDIGVLTMSGSSMDGDLSSGEKKEKEKNHVCPQCGFASAHKSALDRHTQAHSGIKPYKCTQENCDYACAQKGNLSRHMKKVHQMDCPSAKELKAAAKAAALATPHSLSPPTSMPSAMDDCLHTSSSDMLSLPSSLPQGNQMDYNQAFMGHDPLSSKPFT